MSLETATSRTGFVGVGEWVVAVAMLFVTAARLERRVEVRAGVAAMLGVVVDGVVMAMLKPKRIDIDVDVGREI